MIEIDSAKGLSAKNYSAALKQTFSLSDVKHAYLPKQSIFALYALRL